MGGKQRKNRSDLYKKPQTNGKQTSLGNDNPVFGRKWGE